jgi:glycosyltransferase involved in cell wall biosynthesis
MITTFYPPYNFGGDGIFVQRLADALARRGHLVTVIHCVDAWRLGGGTEPVAAMEHHPNIAVHALESPTGMLSPLITHQLAIPGLKARAIRRVLSENTFDVIHFHNISLVGGPGILAYGDAVKLYTAHEYWLVCPLSTLWKFRREPCVTKSCVACTLHARKPPQWWRYTNWLESNLKHLDAMISPSRYLIYKHREMGLRAEFAHIPNFLPAGADAPAHSDATATSGTTRPFFLLVGRLEKSKGFQRVIEVFQRFSDADLVIIGSGQFESELRAMAQGCDHVRFLGQMSYASLQAYYRGAVAVIVPSIWFEPFGLIVIEAYAQHTPVIVNNAGALPELIADSEGGVVYDDDAGLERALETLLRSAAQRELLGQKGYDAYRRLWTEERHLEQYFNLIHSVMQQPKQSAPTG